MGYASGGQSRGFHPLARDGGNENRPAEVGRSLTFPGMTRLPRCNAGGTPHPLIGGKT